jgi:hypothetical protein
LKLRLGAAAWSESVAESALVRVTAYRAGQRAQTPHAGRKRERPGDYGIALAWKARYGVTVAMVRAPHALLADYRSCSTTLGVALPSNGKSGTNEAVQRNRENIEQRNATVGHRFVVRRRDEIPYSLAPRISESLTVERQPAEAAVT